MQFAENLQFQDLQPAAKVLVLKWNPHKILNPIALFKVHQDYKVAVSRFVNCKWSLRWWIEV